MIFAAAFLKDRAYGYIIAADAGLGAALALGITPDLVVGDFDTFGRKKLNDFLVSSGDRVQCELYDPEKDETDTALAFRAAAKRGFSSADVLGATGSRADHELANIFLMWKMLKEGLAVTYYDEKNRMSVLDASVEGTRIFEKRSMYGKYISFIPLTNEVRGITLTGFSYPLEDRDISVLSEPDLCVSNELSKDRGVITFGDGALLVVESHD